MCQYLSTSVARNWAKPAQLTHAVMMTSRPAPTNCTKVSVSTWSQGSLIEIYSRSYNYGAPSSTMSNIKRLRRKKDPIRTASLAPAVHLEINYIVSFGTHKTRTTVADSGLREKKIKYP